MTIYGPILESLGDVKIVPVYSDDEFTETDGPSTYEQAYTIAQNSGIRISSNKELVFVAEDADGKVFGAVWKDLSVDPESSEYYGDEVWCYDFDVAVDIGARAKGLTSAKIGIKLVDAAIEDFRAEKSELGNAYIKVWVVNPKLAQWLEYNRGFEPAAMSKDGSGIMTYNESSEYDDLDNVDGFSEYDDLPDIDSFSCSHRHNPHDFGSACSQPASHTCDACGLRFCDRHIVAVAERPVRDLCHGCLLKEYPATEFEFG